MITVVRNRNKLGKRQADMLFALDRNLFCVAPRIQASFEKSALWTVSTCTLFSAVTNNLPPAWGSPHTAVDSDSCCRASHNNTAVVSYQLGTEAPQRWDKVTGSNTLLINNLELEQAKCTPASEAALSSKALNKKRDVSKV